MKVYEVRCASGESIRDRVNVDSDANPLVLAMLFDRVRALEIEKAAVAEEEEEEEEGESAETLTLHTRRITRLRRFRVVSSATS